VFAEYREIVCLIETEKIGTYTDAPLWLWSPPASILGCSLVGTPCPLANRSKVRDFPTFLSPRGECNIPIELSSAKASIF